MKLFELFDDNIEYHKDLFPGLWSNNKLVSDVKTHILMAVKVFLEFVKIELRPIDIVVTGSMANYNYNEKSDIDVHILVDFNKVSDVDVLKELFATKKSLWSKIHDISIKGHPIELYIGDINEPSTKDSGCYSLKTNKWINEPKWHQFNIDDDTIAKKTLDIKMQLDDALRRNNIELLKKLNDMLHDMRETGIHNGGEFSPENLVFKLLRNYGYMDKIKDAIRKEEDSEINLESI